MPGMVTGAVHSLAIPRPLCRPWAHLGMSGVHGWAWARARAWLGLSPNTVP